MSLLHLVVPDTVGDPRQPSGGNVYDEELARGLRATGHVVREHRLATAWLPDERASKSLAGVLASLGDDSVVLVDGLLGLGAHEVLEREQQRLSLWLLVHLPFGLAGGDHATERRALSAATGVITTSEWARRWILDTYGALPVFVARPGVRAAPVSPGTVHGNSLLCVGALVPGKGQRMLLAALADLRELDWSCRIVGPLDRDPGYAATVREQAREFGDRVTVTGPLARDHLYGNADLLVFPTRLEMYGMVVTEALARGIPVLAGDTGGVAEALGQAPDGRVPGLLVPPGDVRALRQALRRWLLDEQWRARLRAAAQARRAVLEDWSATARAVARALGATVLAEERR